MKHNVYIRTSARLCAFMGRKVRKMKRFRNVKYILVWLDLDKSKRIISKDWYFLTWTCRLHIWSPLRKTRTPFVCFCVKIAFISWCEFIVLQEQDKSFYPVVANDILFDCSVAQCEQYFTLWNFVHLTSSCFLFIRKKKC